MVRLKIICAETKNLPMKKKPLIIKTKKQEWRPTQFDHGCLCSVSPPKTFNKANIREIAGGQHFTGFIHNYFENQKPTFWQLPGERTD